jgi:NAD(P)-dependent dehydrogenase (short-subunit alcohol dehydrogenase family)
MIFTARFAGKVAVVTGAAQGIGATVALRIAHEGGGLVLVDRSALVEEVRHEAEAAGAEAIAIIADLETFSGATEAIDEARERFGRIDILVNNVGGTIWAKPYAEYGEAEIEAEIRRSLFPTLWCCRAALPACWPAAPASLSTCLLLRRAASIACPTRQRRAASMRSPRLSRWNTRRTASAFAASRPAAPRPHRGASRATPQSRVRGR